MDYSAVKRDILTTLFSSRIPKVENSQFFVNFEAMGENDAPIVITQNEYMRRMKEMAALQPGMSFYGEMPDSYSLIVNTGNPLVKKLGDEADSALTQQVQPLMDEVEANNKRIEEIRGAHKDSQLPAEESKQVEELQSANNTKREEQTRIVSDYAAKQPLVSQLIDLALLGNGMLRGADLQNFISRSLELLN